MHRRSGCQILRGKTTFFSFLFCFKFKICLKIAKFCHLFTLLNIPCLNFALLLFLPIFIFLCCHLCLKILMWTLYTQVLLFASSPTSEGIGVVCDLAWFKINVFKNRNPSVCEKTLRSCCPHTQSVPFSIFYLYELYLYYARYGKFAIIGKWLNLYWPEKCRFSGFAWYVLDCQNLFLACMMIYRNFVLFEWIICILIIPESLPDINTGLVLFIFFNGAFLDLLRKQNRTERQISQNAQARVFPMRSAGSKELFSTRESS